MDSARQARIYQMWTNAGGRVHLEATSRRVRVQIAGVTIADSCRARLLYLPPPNSCYVFPEDDVRMDLLHDTGESTSSAVLGRQRLWSIEAGGKTAAQAAWGAVEPPGELAELTHMVAFRWGAMDAWYEEDDEVFVHPRDPYHRVDVLNSSRHVEVMVDGEVVARSDRPRLLFETHLPTRYYIPKVDVRQDVLVPSETTTRCPYKGVASYYSVRIGEKVHPDLAWYYPLPIPECPKIENLISFFNERVDLHVDGQEVERPRSPWST